MNKDFNFQKPTKNQNIDAYVDLFKSRNEFDIPFVTTVVFRSSGYNPNPVLFSTLYEHKFLWHINKKISRRPRELLFYYDFYRYEFGESSRFKSVADQRKPHHVHGIILIPRKKIHKIWDQENSQISRRLEKDFNTIENVSSVHMEPIIECKMRDWISYIVKGKDFHKDQ